MENPSDERRLINPLLNSYGPTFREVFIYQSPPDVVFLLPLRDPLHSFKSLPPFYYFNNRNSFGLFSDRIFLLQKVKGMYCYFIAFFFNLLQYYYTLNNIGWRRLISAAPDASTFHSNWIGQIC